MLDSIVKRAVNRKLNICYTKLIHWCVHYKTSSKDLGHMLKQIKKGQRRVEPTTLLSHIKQHMKRVRIYSPLVIISVL